MAFLFTRQIKFLSGVTLLLFFLYSPAFGQEARVTVADASAREGRNLRFVLTLSDTVTGGCVVEVSFSSISADGDGTDFSSATQSVTFKGEPDETQVVTVTTTDDQVAEGSEQFSVILSTDANGVDVSDSATGTIEDNDKALITIGNAKANEGDELVFTLKLDKKVKQGFTVDVRSQNGTAGPNDYSPAQQSFVFEGNANETHQITIHSLADKTPNEGDEDLTLSLVISPNLTHIDGTSTGRGIISDFTDCRYCPSKVYLDTVEQFSITFFGDGNLQKSVQSGDDIAATTGVGVLMNKYFRTLPGQKFGPWYRAELMAQINVASSVDTISAEMSSGTPPSVANRSSFGSSMLTPLNSGQAVDLKLRLFNKVTYGGFLSGFELRYIGSNRNWKLNSDTIGQINTNLARVIAFHDFVSYDKRDDYSVMLRAGYAANWIRGDLGSRANNEIRKRFIATKTRTFHGVELGLGFKLKNILADFAYTIFPEDANVPGLTGSRLVTTIKFVGGFNIKVD